MAWIESHQSLLTHRKTLRASLLLKVNKYQVIGHLHALWWWALDNAEADGDLGQVLYEEIAEAAGWSLRRAQEFVTALWKVGFLDSPDDGQTFVLHDWWEYAGKLATQRELRKASNRERQRAYRQRLSHTGNGDVTRDVRGSNQPTSPHLTQPNPTVESVANSTPANGARKAAREHVLNLSTAEWSQLVTEFPGVNLQELWREWVQWIEEEEERGRSKTPRNKFQAFRGFVRNKTTAAPAAGRETV